jgi:hypothetical protein
LYLWLFKWGSISFAKTNPSLKSDLLFHCTCRSHIICSFLRHRSPMAFFLWSLLFPWTKMLLLHLWHDRREGGSTLYSILGTSGTDRTFWHHAGLLWTYEAHLWVLLKGAPSRPTPGNMV